MASEFEGGLSRSFEAAMDIPRLCKSWWKRRRSDLEEEPNSKLWFSSGQGSLALRRDHRLLDLAKIQQGQGGMMAGRKVLGSNRNLFHMWSTYLCVKFELCYFVWPLVQSQIVKGGNEIPKDHKEVIESWLNMQEKTIMSGCDVET